MLTPGRQRGGCSHPPNGGVVGRDVGRGKGAVEGAGGEGHLSNMSLTKDQSGAVDSTWPLRCALWRILREVLKKQLPIRRDSELKINNCRIYSTFEPKKKFPWCD